MSTLPQENLGYSTPRTSYPTHPFNLKYTYYCTYKTGQENKKQKKHCVHINSFTKKKSEFSVQYFVSQFIKSSKPMNQYDIYIEVLNKNSKKKKKKKLINYVVLNLNLVTNN